MRTATLATGLVLVACSWTYAQDVRTNYMPGTEFSKYHTYAWVNDVEGIPEVGGQIDQILDAQIKQAIDSQMAIKGFTKAPSGSEPDLLLGYQAVLSQEKQVNGSAWGGGWGGWGGLGPWGAALLHFQPPLPPSTSGRSCLGSTTLLQRSSCG